MKTKIQKIKKKIGMLGTCEKRGADFSPNPQTPNAPESCGPRIVPQQIK